MELFITNGDFFNEYFEKSFGKKGIVFREAMMSGPLKGNLFSSHFINARASFHIVSKEKYLDNLKDFLNVKDKKDVTRINLFFGEDTFCMVNLITVLAYLEIIDYHGLVYLNIVCDYSNKILKKDIKIELGIYRDIYDKVLIKKEKPNNLGVISEHAIDLYFDYLSNNSALIKLIKDNINDDEISLITKLLNASKEYGISDVMAKDLIKKVRS